MKNISLAMLLTAFVSVPAVAGDMYLGGKLGFADYNYSPISNNSQFAPGIFGGYNINNSFAVEAEYTDLGGFDTVSRIYKGSAFGVSGVYSYHFNDTYSLSGKLGLASTSLEATPQAGYSLTGVTSYDKTGLTIGVRGQYEATPAIGIRAGIDIYAVDASYSGGVSTAGGAAVVSVGGVFKF